MEIRLTVLETILMVIGSFSGGIILFPTLDGNMESGFIYFGLIMLAVRILILKKRTSKRS